MKRVAFAAILGVLTASQGALAGPTKDECVAAYKGNQPLRRDGRLREAIEQLLVCSRDPCPAVLQSDCIEWLREAQAMAPSIVVRARAGASREVADVRVLMDGVEIAPRLDGRTIEIDPGEHSFVFERAGSGPVTKKLLIMEGEKGRVIDVDVTLSSSLQSPTPAPGRPVPWTVYAFGGLALGALGLGGTFAATGVAARQDLFDCKPGCSTERIDSVASRFLVADVALSVGALSLAAALVFYFTRPSTSPARTSAVLPNGGLGRMF